MRTIRRVAGYRFFLVGRRLRIIRVTALAALLVVAPGGAAAGQHMVDLRSAAGRLSADVGEPNGRAATGAPVQLARPTERRNVIHPTIE